MVKTYCLKERKVTEGSDPKILRTKNNRVMERTIWRSCGIYKYRFIKDVNLILHI